MAALSLSCPVKLNCNHKYKEKCLAQPGHAHQIRRLPEHGRLGMGTVPRDHFEISFIGFLNDFKIR